MGRKNYIKKKSSNVLQYPVFKSKFLSRSANLFSLTFLIAIMKSGIWVFPAIYASFVISQSPFKQPFSNPDDQYLMTTWFSSFLAYMFGIDNLSSFIVLHFISGLLAIILLFRYIKEVVKQPELGKSILLFAMMPVVSTIFYWTGMDSFTFLIMVLFLKYKKFQPAVFCFGIIGGLHHFEILVMSILGLLLFEFLRGSYSFKKKENRSSIIFLLGIILGKLLLISIFKLNGVVVAKSRTTIGLEGLRNNLDLITNYGFLIYWSMLGVLWVILARALSMKNRESFALLTALAVPVLLVFFVRDSTRVIQLTSFLTLAVGVFANERVLQRFSMKQIKFVLVIWLIVPWVWVWQGVFGSITLYSIKYVISRLTNNDLAPWTGNIAMWPFT